MKPKDADKDTVEKIVADAVAREKRINKLHPERHGYGMVEGEADDLIRRIEELERKQLQAQAKSSSRRREKIRLVGMDKLYTHGPEEIVIEQEETPSSSRVYLCETNRGIYAGRNIERTKG